MKIGLNWAIFGMIQTVLICYFFQEKFTTRFTSDFSGCIGFVLLLLLVMVIFHHFCNGFVNIFYNSKPRNQNLNVAGSSFGVDQRNRFVRSHIDVSQYLPKRKVNNDFAKKLIAYFVIPVPFLAIF
jgi:hypothetical protein